ncbi:MULTISPECIES: hypothetical protein [unclassified Chryseobacterium]|uniref:hypothetical protein n=1 Tax=unclassified Chryseobacterium TaxID=2593645 RepID=UPI00300FC8A2
MLQKIIFSLLLFCAIICKSQTITVQGIAKDSLGTIGIGISVNDTIRKFRDRASKDQEFKDKNWDRPSNLINDEKFITHPDSIGNYRITVKITDTLYFFKRKYITQKYKVADIIKNNIEVILKPVPCIPYKKCDQTIPAKLYIFVGKKINVTSVDSSKYCGESMDSEYKAEYKIEQELGDHYPNSTITFTAYDHNSMYEYDFRNYDNVLIFIGEYCGDLIQLKYQFFPVYKTVDGRWASSIISRDEYFYKPETFVPKNIVFDKSVSFDLSRSNNNPSEEQIAQLKKYRFPEKYYKIENGKAIPIMGRYVEDLVKLWRELYEKK